MTDFTSSARGAAMSSATDHNLNDGRSRVTDRPINPNGSGTRSEGHEDRLLRRLFEVHGHEAELRRRR